MIEGSPDDQVKSVESDALFDHEAEKERRKEIRNELERILSDILKPIGFKREGSSKWVRAMGDTVHLVYLQRSHVNHSYYINLGVCNKHDIPEGKKIDITHCTGHGGGSRRLSQLAYDIYKKQHIGEENGDEKAEIYARHISSAHDFEIPDGLEKYPNEDYFPSVAPEEVREKLEIIREAATEYIPAYFKEHEEL